MLIRGDQLNAAQRRQVFAAFIYRWTTGNTQRLAAYSGRSHPTRALMNDEEWLADFAFHFTKDGLRLMHNRKFAEPVFLTEDD